VKRPTAEVRRLDYLRIGADLVNEFSPSAPMAALANVKIADVAERAGVTKGAVYHIWESQEAYRRDLLAHLVREDSESGFEAAADLLHQPGSDQWSPQDRLRVMCDAAFDRLKDNAAYAARFSFYLFAESPEIRSLLERSDDDIDRFWIFFESYLRRTGRQLRPSFSKRGVVVIVSALFDGLILRHRTSPETTDRTIDRDGVAWRTYPYGVLTLIDSFSEPIDGTADQDRS
jgi:AcrR family transcriptional regulator